MPRRGSSIGRPRRDRGALTAELAATLDTAGGSDAPERPDGSGAAGSLSVVPLRRTRELAVAPSAAFAQFLTHLESVEHRADDTLRSYRVVLRLAARYLEETRGRRDVWEVSADDLQQWLVMLRAAPSAATGRMRSVHSVRNYGRHLLACWRWLERVGLAPAHVSRGVRLPRVLVEEQPRPATFTEEEIDALFVACGEDGEEGNLAEQQALRLRNQALLAVLLDTGVRVRELVSLHVEGVHWDTLALDVRQSKTLLRTVGFGRERTQPLLRRYLQAARPWLAEQMPPQSGVTVGGGPLWLGRDGEPLTREGVKMLFQRLSRRCTITSGKCTPHTCRRYAITRALQAGMSIHEAARAFGVSAEVISRHYFSATQREIVERMRSTSPMDKHLQDALRRQQGQQGPHGGRQARPRLPSTAEDG